MRNVHPLVALLVASLAVLSTGCRQPPPDYESAAGTPSASTRVVASDADADPRSTAGPASDDELFMLSSIEQETDVGERTPDVVYVPTPTRVVDAMLKAAEVGPEDVLYDLGSGDGRIPVAAAKRWGTRGVGIDIDPQRIREANRNAEQAGVTDKVKFIEGDLFDADLSEATVITLYLLPALNLRLRPTLLELEPGTRIVSHAFDMGDWEPEQTIDADGATVYRWTVPETVPSHLR